MTAAAMKPSEALRAARELITPEGAWMQGALVSKQGDQGVRVDDPHADCFCSFGAILKASSGDHLDLCVYMERVTKSDSIVRWNDTLGRTHAEILDAFDRAAALAESEGW